MTGRHLVVTRRTAGALLALAVLAGCAQDVPPTPPSTSPTGPTAGPTNGATPTDQDTALRQRLAAALRTEDPREAALVENALTDLTAVGSPRLPGWQVVDVSYRGVPHGRRFSVGLADDGRVVHLAGAPEAFNAMTAASGLEVADASTATALAQVALDATRTFVHYAYRVEDVADVDWLTTPTSQQRAERRRVERTYASRITRPRARKHGTGWALTLWTVDDRSLVEHTVVVDRAGQVSDSPRTLEQRLPVPESV